MATMIRRLTTLFRSTAATKATTTTATTTTTQPARRALATTPPQIYTSLVADPLMIPASALLTRPKDLPNAAAITSITASTTTTQIHKPWPYSLPEFLRPVPGTTLGDAYAGTEGVKGAGKIGWWAYVLYGVPEGKLDGRDGLKKEK